MLDVPDVINDEAGGGNEEIVHSVEAPADRLCVNGVVGDSSAGLIDHLVKTNREAGGCLKWAWWIHSVLLVSPH